VQSWHADSNACGFFDLCDDFFVLWEAANVFFAPDLRAVDMHVENTARALDHFSVYAELALNRFRQTGGGGEVVSLHAVFDADFHSGTPFVIESVTAGTFESLTTLAAERPRRR
jgi:hypothetical protein